MKKSTLITSLLILFLFPYKEVYAKVHFVSISLGGTKNIDLPKGTPINIKLSGKYREFATVQYKRSKKQLNIQGKARGFGILIIKNSSGKVLHEYHISVVGIKIDRTAHDIRKLLHHIEGIEVRLFQGRVLIDGEIISPKDAIRISKVVSIFGDDVGSLVALSPIAQNRIAEIMQRAINHPEVTVRAVNGFFMIEGKVQNQEEKAKAELVARVYIPGNYIDHGTSLGSGSFSKKKNGGILNLISVQKDAQQPSRAQKVIQIVAHFVEMSKSYNKHFRFQWMPSLESKTNITYTNRAVGGTTSEISAVINNLLPKLNWAKQHGYARILKTWSVTTENNIEGVISSSRQIVYITESGLKPVTASVSMKVKPKIIDQANNIRLENDFNVQSLVSQNETSARNIKTSVVVKSGESAAIGGILEGRSSTGMNRIPEGADPNPLISLYSAKNYDRGNSQFIIFVTPTLKTSASEGMKELRKKFRIYN